MGKYIDTIMELDFSRLIDTGGTYKGFINAQLYKIKLTDPVNARRYIPKAARKFIDKEFQKKAS